MIYQIIKNADCKVSNWSGGKTCEIFIYPPDSIYSERNFEFRISSATVDLPESTFTKLPAYSRYIMPLQGQMELSHNQQQSITLQPYQKNYFMGSDDTISRGTCTDFNLMLALGLDGDIWPLEQDYSFNLNNKFSGIYILAENIGLNIKANDEDTLLRLSKGDFVYFNRQELTIKLSPIDFMINNQPWAIAVKVVK